MGMKCNIQGKFVTKACPSRLYRENTSALVPITIFGANNVIASRVYNTTIISEMIFFNDMYCNYTINITEYNIQPREIALSVKTKNNYQLVS